MSEDETPAVARQDLIGWIREAEDALEELEARFPGRNRATLANRAVQVYAFVERELAAGGRLLVEGPDGKTVRVTVE